MAGDKAAFYGCRMVSYQDTLLDDTGRHYYKSCYIEGATDFICGNAASLFEVSSLLNYTTDFIYMRLLVSNNVEKVTNQWKSRRIYS